MDVKAVKNKRKEITERFSKVLEEFDGFVAKISREPNMNTPVEIFSGIYDLRTFLERAVKVKEAWHNILTKYSGLHKSYVAIVKAEEYSLRTKYADEIKKFKSNDEKLAYLEKYSSNDKMVRDQLELLVDEVTTKYSQIKFRLDVLERQRMDLIMLKGLFETMLKNEFYGAKFFSMKEGEHKI